MRAIIVCFVLVLFCWIDGIDVFAIEEEQMFSVNLTENGTTYVFTYGRSLCIRSLLSRVVRDSLQKSYNHRLSGDSLYVLTPDSLSQVALEKFFASNGVAFTKEVINLSAASKADIVASGITEKWRLAKYISMCVVFRNDNPLWSDATVRAVAKSMTQ